MSTFPANKALELLRGEPQGFAIDATTEGGSIAVKDTTTKANNHLISGVTTDFRNGLDSFNEVRAGAVKLVQSGTSPKVVLKADGTVGWTPHNLFKRSEELTHTDWTLDASGGTMSISANAAVAPDGAKTAESITSTSGASPYLTQTAAVTTVSGDPWTVSFHLKYVSGSGWMRIAVNTDGSSSTTIRGWFDLVNGVTGATAGSPISTAIVSAGGGWYRCSLTVAAPSTTLYPFLTTANADNSITRDTATVYAWGAQANKGYVAAPYLVTTSAARIGIPQSYDAAAEQHGILVEPAATNLATYSLNLSSNWNTDTASLATNNATAPDGTTTAARLTAASGAGQHFVAEVGVSLTSPTTYTFSFFAKAGTAQFIQCDVARNGGEYASAVFDLTNGLATDDAQNTMTFVSKGITAVGDGWYRCYMVFTTANTSGQYPALAIANTGTPAPSSYGLQSWTAAGTETVYIWGAQVEVGTVATSFIPTLGNTVTRAKDLAQALASTFPLGPTGTSLTCSMVVQFKQRMTTDSHIASLNDTTANNRIMLQIAEGDRPGWVGVANGSIQFLMQQDNVYTLNTVAKVGGACATNDAALVYNGGSPDTDSSVDFTSCVPTRICVGFGATDSEQLNGFIYQLTYVPRRMTNTELQVATTP